MSNSNVITRETIVDTLANLTKSQEMTLEGCEKSIAAIRASGKITESNLRLITNTWRELDSLREVFFTRLLNSLKRGDMILN